MSSFPRKVKYRLLLGCVFILQQSVTSAQTSQKIERLISKMTLEEKVGQMTNLTLGTVGSELGDSLVINVDKLRDIIINHKVGSFQNVISHAYSLSNWRQMLDQIQQINMRESRLKIPLLYAIDAVHGADYTLGSTIFPHNLGLAATRNLDYARSAAQVTAKEVRASGIRYNFSPVLDAGRQPLWPRLAETFGEDINLVTKMGVAEIYGYEGKDLKSVNSVAACMKHFIGYSLPTSGKDRSSALIPDITLREFFLPSFAAAVKAGARTVMVNSAEVNGIPVHANKYLLTDVLRKELGFKGVVISDWEDVKKLNTRHRIADSYKEAVFKSVNAGIDLCIVPMDLDFSKYLIALVKERRITMTRIDQSVRRVLQLKYELGLFDHPYAEKEAIRNFARPEYQTIALNAARESITLLKNEKAILPLAKDRKLLITGPGANSLSALNGAWTYSWQGTSSKYFSKKQLTIFQAIHSKANNTSFTIGTNFKGIEDEIAKAVEEAKNVDEIIVCLGEDAYAETPGNIEDLELPDNQLKLVAELSKLNKPIIAVLTEGRPRLIRKIEPYLSGIIMAYWPGEQGANAIADVLFGDYNPSGKLPVTYPKYPNSLVTYDHKYLDESFESAGPQNYAEEFKPQFPFGFGLSYTKFDYSKIIFSSPTLHKNDFITIQITVTNAGKMPGDEVVEMYSSDLIASVTPSVKRLRDFIKVYLAPGESKEISFKLTPKDLAFVGRDLKWITEPGRFQITIGNQKKELVYSAR